MTYRSLCQNYPFDDAMKYLELEKVVGSLHFQQAAQPSQPAGRIEHKQRYACRGNVKARTLGNDCCCEHVEVGRVNSVVRRWQHALASVIMSPS